MGRKGKRRAIAAAVHRMANDRRRQQGLDDVDGDLDLASDAEAYAREMARRDRLGHHVDGTAPQDRYDGVRGIHENVCYVSASGSPGRVAGRAVKRWVNSRPHRANLFESAVSISGVGCWFNGDTAYLVQVFVERCSTVADVLRL